MKRSYRYLCVTLWILVAVLGWASTNTEAQTCAPAPVGLVSWWSADGNALDSRSRLNGALQGNAALSAGQVGQAFNLDGNNDSVQIPHDASQNINGSFSAEAWIFPRTVPTAGPRIFDKDTAVANSPRWLMSIGTANQLSATINGSSVDTPNNAISLNQWNHAAFTYDAATGQLRVFVNGVQLANLNIGPQTAITTAPLFIGDDSGTSTREFDGLIDEPAIYDRALSPTELAAIHAAGTAGKCKPTATVAPSGLAGWWSGDGNANDIAGTNSGTLENGATFTTGKVGQAFGFDGINDNVNVTSSGIFNSQPGGTIEAWIKPEGGHGDGTGFVFYEDTGVQGFSRFGVVVANDGAVGVGGRDTVTGNTGTGKSAVTAAAAAPLNSWTHVAGVWQVGVGIKVYVNGVLSATLNDATVANFSADSPQFIRIGSFETTTNTFNEFNGEIDEVSLYHRALTDIEIAAIFSAGIAGKLKSSGTPVGFAEDGTKGTREIYSPEGTGVVVTVGDATITLPSVTTAGTTQEIPLVPGLFPALPMGAHTGLVYDIATSAAFSGSPTVCFNLPSFTSTQFANLRVLHLEGGVWVNRTAASNTFPTLCSDGLTSLSAFAIVEIGPAAANVAISGRVVTTSGRGIAKARILLTDFKGISRYTLTSTFGYYRFDDVRVGEAFLLSVGAKRYMFSPSNRVIMVFDEVTDADFIASP